MLHSCTTTDGSLPDPIGRWKPDCKDAETFEDQNTLVIGFPVLPSWEREKHKLEHPLTSGNKANTLKKSSRQARALFGRGRSVADGVGGKTSLNPTGFRLLLSTWQTLS